MKEFSLFEIVKKLNGEIQPVGDSTIDEKRFENLNRFLTLAEDMILEIERVSGYIDSPRFSEKRAAKIAKVFLDNLEADRGEHE